jgi:hypothetical protein
VSNSEVPRDESTVLRNGTTESRLDSRAEKLKAAQNEDTAALGKANTVMGQRRRERHGRWEGVDRERFRSTNRETRSGPWEAETVDRMRAARRRVGVVLTCQSS